MPRWVVCSHACINPFLTIANATNTAKRRRITPCFHLRSLEQRTKSLGQRGIERVRSPRRTAGASGRSRFNATRSALEMMQGKDRRTELVGAYGAEQLSTPHPLALSAVLHQPRLSSEYMQTPPPWRIHQTRLYSHRLQNSGRSAVITEPRERSGPVGELRDPQEQVDRTGSHRINVKAIVWC